MSTCYQCFTITKLADSDGIGVCQICNSLACPRHGGLPRERPAFHCSRCIEGLVTLSAGGSPEAGRDPGGGTGTPEAGPPEPGGDGTGGAAAPAFRSSVDFETQLSDLAQASVDQRGAVDLDGVRESVRRLFGLLRDEAARHDFLARIANAVREPVRDEVDRQMRQRPNAYTYWAERGGLDGGTATEVDAIVGRYRRWLAEELEPWLASIYPVLDENVWVGARDEVGGAVNVLLLADAIGLRAYNWGIDVEDSPFRRLDIVAGADPGLVVLASLYAELVYA